MNAGIVVGNVFVCGDCVPMDGFFVAVRVKP